MCGRFGLTREASRELAYLLEEVDHADLSFHRPRYNIAPTPLPRCRANPAPPRSLERLWTKTGLGTCRGRADRRRTGIRDSKPKSWLIPPTVVIIITVMVSRRWRANGVPSSFTRHPCLQKNRQQEVISVETNCINTSSVFGTIRTMYRHNGARLGACCT
jgi:hypothetical protein